MKRILLVDDDEDMRRGMKRRIEAALALAGFSCEVTEAVDGADGVEKMLLQNPDFDLVVSDHNMPNRTGLGLLAEIRKGSGLRYIPFILMSGKEGEEMREIEAKAKALGADVVIQKNDDAIYETIVGFFTIVNYFAKRNKPGSS